MSPDERKLPAIYHLLELLRLNEEEELTSNSDSNGWGERDVPYIAKCSETALAQYP